MTGSGCASPGNSCTTPCPELRDSLLDSANRRLVKQHDAQTNKKSGRTITLAGPMTSLAIGESRAELLQARFDLGLGKAWMSGSNLCPQPIAAVDIGLQDFHLM